MTEKGREARNAYYRAYRAKHKAQIAAQKERYWDRKAEEEERRRMQDEVTPGK